MVGATSVLALAAVAVAGLGGFADAPIGIDAYPQGPPPAHTGGFGEQTCAECHFGGDPDVPASVRIDGLPETWTPGESYPLTVVVSHPGMRRAGFQLAARFADGDDAGRQAGTLEAVDARATTVEDSTSNVVYAQHTEPGTEIDEEAAGEAHWSLIWTAPEEDDGCGAVVLHVAANAADGDESALGDRVATAEMRVGAATEAGGR